MSSPKSLPTVLLGLALACPALAETRAVELAPAQVLGQEPVGEGQGMEEAAARLAQVPGGTNVVDMRRPLQGRVASNQDVLAYQPGVYAQSAGNEGVKISIRGSGINRAPGAHASGLYTMLDGLPLTGPGGTPYELLEPLWVDHVEVLRGANGFDRGALALGGAIDYVSHTGYDAPLLQVRYATGSHGYQQRQVSSGQVLGDFDYYVSLTDSNADGYQDHTRSQSKGLIGNFGYRFNPNLETRFYLRYRETDNDLAGRVTKRSIEHDPRAANPAYVSRDDRRKQPGSTFVGNKTTYYLDDDSSIQAGLVYHDYPMDLREGPNRLKVAYSDVSGTLDYKRRDSLWGLESRSTLGLRVTKHLPNDGASEFVRIPTGNTANYAPGTRIRNFTYQGSDTVLHVGNDLEIADDLWLTTGLAAIYTRRESAVTYPEGGGKTSLGDWDYAPRLGLRYQLNPDLQLFANLSRSVEAPHPWSLIYSANQRFPAGSGVATGAQRDPVKLRNQTATTLELGGRGDSSLGQWSLAWYYAQVRHELLSVLPDANATTPYELNASPTVHQGVEASLQSELWSRPGVGRLSLRQAYTFSDFHYRDDQRFANNRLPGLPMHYYQGELRYDWPLGFFAALNTQLVSKVAVDYANSYYADPYALFGATLGYNAPKNDWQTWVDVRNLTDKRYAATVTPGYDDKGLDAARSTPGEGLGVYLGVSWSLR
ncbi:iron complex outermembrane recepter protein [Pseudomonas sp. NFPP10]|uniref:TonB-dependent receptor family protein n=1 Tax=unclassified Pseudomonas TaxID=196821 RepID=UPI00088DC654|nr:MULTISPECIES: TonB-dependent receptor [unclassified Pseudomonas]SDA13753.1 iron complex outermembrane recepter protein [Pseudomonas sp. NFPP12]SEK26498.1 iron complex outermembrane recepter protein [Pseudomonas sp. NFPP10]SFI09021.1 iron complex outermembrane recepter protein [Pseudomonas sp. NFPP08]SFM24450.1 iron complex outermembrane recepter protein [Pseudomonas sp. NFPP05]SFX14030.1 iron complex outermembrane recepter protein [Pseudomonas sp. NFPP09]